MVEKEMIKQKIKKIIKKLTKRIKEIPIIFLLAVLLCAVLVFFGFQTFKYFKTQRSEMLAEQLQKEQAEMAKELKDQLQDEELADLKQQILDLKNKVPETQTITNTVTVEAKDTLVDIIKEWSPRVVYMECNWFTVNGSLYARSSGSATVVNFAGLGLRAVTSQHILLDKNNFTPRDCKITLTDETVYSISINQNNVNINKDEDWAYITLPTDDILSNITKKNVKLCSSVEVGDKLLILGYPKIGSKTGLTVTEGIVSGFDGSYYITSAKIDKGNSGGAAILVKDDCYLGIPSASVVGVIESLGRILKASFVIGN